MIVAVNKPKGITSFDVVKYVRKETGVKKVGHAGTLDPFAEGVLVLGLGPSTKELTSVSHEQKEYHAWLQLGKTTNTLDSDGEITNEKQIPEFDDMKIADVFKSFTGVIPQIPPMFSAKKMNGVRLYKLARKNIEIEREPVKVHIYKLDLISFENNVIEFTVVCSRGTYIRQLGADISEALGTVGYLIKLVRLSVGNYKINECLNLSEFKEQWKSIES
tara:strand:- start:5216 stop:5869 length:654 start_codon:yes stop_codon:yes gene_type:complete